MNARTVAYLDTLRRMLEWDRKAWLYDDRPDTHLRAQAEYFVSASLRLMRSAA